jgi:hypothetical protein
MAQPIGCARNFGERTFVRKPVCEEQTCERVHDGTRPQHSDRRPQHSDRRPQHSDRRPQHSDRRPQHNDRHPKTIVRNWINKFATEQTKAQSSRETYAFNFSVKWNPILRDFTKQYSRHANYLEMFELLNKLMIHDFLFGAFENSRNPTFFNKATWIDDEGSVCSCSYGFPYLWKQVEHHVRALVKIITNGQFGDNTIIRYLLAELSSYHLWELLVDCEDIVINFGGEKGRFPLLHNAIWLKYLKEPIPFIERSVSDAKKTITFLMNIGFSTSILNEDGEDAFTSLENVSRKTWMDQDIVAMIRLCFRFFDKFHTLQRSFGFEPDDVIDLTQVTLTPSQIREHDIYVDVINRYFLVMWTSDEKRMSDKFISPDGTPLFLKDSLCYTRK